MDKLAINHFLSVDLRVGTIIQADPFPQACKPAYQLRVDLGPEIGVKKSSAQITKLYTVKELIGRQVICVVNLEPRQIGPFMSEVLVTGLVEGDEVTLISPDRKVSNGLKLA